MDFSKKEEGAVDKELKHSEIHSFKSPPGSGKEKLKTTPNHTSNPSNPSHPLKDKSKTPVQNNGNATTHKQEHPPNGKTTTAQNNNSLTNKSTSKKLSSNNNSNVENTEITRKRANAQNFSMEIEKSVIEETVKEFENLEITKKKERVTELNNSKEEHKDILIKINFMNIEEFEIDEPNQMAMQAIERINKKFQGKDFEKTGSLNALTHKEQVHRLIAQAADPFNLCQSYSGWNPFM